MKRILVSLTLIHPMPELWDLADDDMNKIVMLNKIDEWSTRRLAETNLVATLIHNKNDPSKIALLMQESEFPESGRQRWFFPVARSIDDLLSAESAVEGIIQEHEKSLEAATC